MKSSIQKATLAHLDELERLYDDSNTFLESTTNYPGWIKGIYPIKETAEKGIYDNNLFILLIDGAIRGSVILNHTPEEAYKNVNWKYSGADYSLIIVVHTLVVHPEFLSNGVAHKLMTFAEEYCSCHKFKSIRLDVSIHNLPAINLYKKLGYKYIDTVDLGLEYEHLKWFRLYEKLITEAL